MRPHSRSIARAAHGIHGRHRIAAVLLALAGSIAHVAVAETMNGGPIPVANLTPFVQTRLEPGVPRPLQGRIGEWSLDATLSHGNTFIMSNNVGRYLKVRGERRPLDAGDIAALDATGEDFYYLDVNVSRLTLEATVLVTPKVAGFVRLPVIHRGGGQVDSLIEGFHDAFGFDSAGRDLVARDRFQGVARIGGDSVTQLDPGSGTHVGNPVLGLRHEAGDWLGWSWQWTAAVKPSLSQARIVVANGATDASLQLAARRYLGDAVLWLAVDNVWTGGSDIFPTAHRGTIPGVQAVYERPLGPATELVLQASASASTISAAGGSLSPLSDPEYQMTIGLRRYVGKAMYSIALTENVSNFDNSSDFGLHLSVTWR